MNKEIEKCIHEFAKQMYQAGYEQGYNDCKVELLEDEAKCHYQEGYNDGYRKGVERGKEARVAEADCAYQCGMNRAWKAARKIVLSAGNGGYSADTVMKLFGMTYHDVLVSASPLRVIEKIEAWEKKQEQIEKNCKNCAHQDEENIHLCNDCRDYSFSRFKPKEKREQTEKNCKECEIYSKALRGKLTVKQIEENCEGCTLKECLYEPKQEQTKKTCDTCEHGEAYKQGSDITTMDDECGGCCSWNSKWTPKEDTIGNSVKSIGFGDEVVDNLGHVMMVTYIAVESKCADVLKSDGTTDQMPLEILEKTGKHYDIQALLDAMKSEKTEEGGENVHE